jgi:hypothetical protein
MRTVAEAPDFVPRQVTHYKSNDGQTIAAENPIEKIKLEGPMKVDFATHKFYRSWLRVGSQWVIHSSFALVTKF